MLTPQKPVRPLPKALAFSIRPQHKPRKPERRISLVCREADWRICPIELKAYNGKAGDLFRFCKMSVSMI
jgi:hypothetical protein